MESRLTPQTLGSFAIPILLILLSRSSVADPAPKANATGTELRAAAATAQTPDSATQAFRDLFKEASDDSLVALKTDPHLGIAFYAAHRLRSSSNPRLAASGHPERFIGFLEGRSGISFPPSWASWFVMNTDRRDLLPTALEMNDLLPAALKTYGPLGHVEILDDEVGLKPGEGIPSTSASTYELHRTQLDSHAMQCPKSIEVRDGRLIVEKTVIPLQDKFTKALRRAKARCGLSDGYFNVLVFDEKAFVVVWSTMPTKYPIFCLDSVSGKLLWESEVWARFPEGYSYFGNFLHVVELTANRTTVGVFGISHATIYAEAFEIESGKSEFRFSPDLWGQHPDSPKAKFPKASTLVPKETRERK